MPKRILGKPVDEAKWEKAKQLAEEQGHGGEYDYIMGIYKRMMKLDKGLDTDAEARDTESRRERKLVVKAKYPHRMVCKSCGHLLFKSKVELASAGIEIKCKKCATINEL